jgi:hypothetical protein
MPGFQSIVSRTLMWSKVVDAIAKVILMRIKCETLDSFIFKQLKVYIRMQRLALN